MCVCHISSLLMLFRRRRPPPLLMSKWILCKGGGGSKEERRAPLLCFVSGGNCIRFSWGQFCYSVMLLNCTHRISMESDLD